MSRLIPCIAAGSLTAALMACPARTPPPPPAPVAPPVQVPPGCEAGQAGEYFHAENPAFRYRGEDDGTALTLWVTRALPEAGRVPEAGSPVSIVLRRTPEGFVGETRATAFTPAGAQCPVRFATQVTACDTKGLSLRSVASTALDENCLPATSGPAPLWKEQRLLRGAPDAGSPDAGGPDAGSVDAGGPDAGGPDAGSPGSTDAGSPDGGAARRP